MQKQAILTDRAPEPIGPYNQAILVKDTLYISGQIALDVRNGALISGDITKETQQVMHNLGAILEAASMDFGNIIKCSIFIRDMAEFSTINAAYGAYFGDTPPARETVQVSRLPKDANVEISAIAVR